MTDRLGLAVQQARTQETSQQPTKVEGAISQPTQSQQSQTSIPSLQDQIVALTATVERQQQQIDALNYKLNQFVNSPVFVNNEKLSNWLSRLRNKIQTAGQEAVAQVSQKLEQNKATLASKAKDFLVGLKENIADAFHAVHDNVRTKASEIALGAMSAATAKLASTIGEKLPDGSFVIESRDRNQRLEVSGNNVVVKERPQLDAQALWNNYSQGVLPQDRPIQRTLVTAQKAIADGLTRAQVEDMLKADPQFQKVQQEQGLNKATEYALQMVRSASNREQQARKLQQQQQQRRRNQDQGLQQ